MHCHAKTEDRWDGIGHHVPLATTICRTEDTVMVLCPEIIRRGAALRHHVNILDVGIELMFRRHVFREDSLAAELPRSAVILRDPDAAGRDREAKRLRIARITTQRVNSRKIRPTTKPLSAFGPVPQTAHQFPTFAAIIGTE